jgi:hypothetical protein
MVAAGTNTYVEYTKDNSISAGSDVYGSTMWSSRRKLESGSPDLLIDQTSLDFGNTTSGWK